MPYNEISEAAISTENTNLYDENGNPLSESDARYNEPLYFTGGTNEDGSSGKNNYYFGMYLEADFYQPEKGQVTWNGETSDMIFEFNGDDDLWVFIDDVLVLDIGGIHDAHSGSINFAKGTVIVNTGKETIETSIAKMFESAGESIEDGFAGNTFADYTTHTIKLFYMERGAWASNLHIKLNLTTTGSLTLGKEVEGISSDTTIASGTYSFDVIRNSDSTVVETVTLPTSDNKWTVTVDDLIPGTYTVTESAKNVSGYNWVSVKSSSSDGNTGAGSVTATVESGGTATVGFTNTYKKIPSGTSGSSGSSGSSSSSGSSGSAVSTTAAAQTGDSTNIWLPLAGLLVAAAGLGSFGYVSYRKRKRSVKQ